MRVIDWLIGEGGILLVQRWGTSCAIGLFFNGEL